MNIKTSLIKLAKSNPKARVRIHVKSKTGIKQFVFNATEAVLLSQSLINQVLEVWVL